MASLKNTFLPIIYEAQQRPHDRLKIRNSHPASSPLLSCASGLLLSYVIGINRQYLTVDVNFHFIIKRVMAVAALGAGARRDRRGSSGRGWIDRCWADG